MELTEDLKRRIDNMTYYELLEKWRYAKIGDLIFQGPSGEYFSKVMTRKKEEDPAGAVADSKAIGWGSR